MRNTIICLNEYPISSRIEEVLMNNGIDVFNFVDRLRAKWYIESLMCTDFILFIDKSTLDFLQGTPNIEKAGIILIDKDMTDEAIIMEHKHIGEILDMKCNMEVLKIKNDIVIENGKNKLFNSLKHYQEDILNALKDKLSVCVLGDIGTGKSFVSKLSGDNFGNCIVLDGAKNKNISWDIFGNISLEGTNKGLIDMFDVIVIENITELSAIDLQKLATFCLYGQFTRVNGSKRLSSNARFIFVSNYPYKETFSHIGALSRGISRVIELPSINDYTVQEKEDVLKKMFKWGDLIINKGVRFFLNKHKYITNLYELQDIAYTIKRTIGDDFEVKPEDLPTWLTLNKGVDDSVPYNDCLREISDKEIYKLQDAERLIIKGAFKKCLFKKEETAKLLGISTGVLRRKMNEYSIDVEECVDL